MSNHFTSRQVALAGIIGAAYAVLTLGASIFGVAYGPVQMRVSEALTVLPFLFPEAVPGLFVGCLIANLLSPYGVLDVVVGSAATLLAAVLTARCSKRWLAPLPPVLCNAVFIGALIAYYEAGFGSAFLGAFAFNALTVGVGEAVSCYVLGMLLLHWLPKSRAVRTLIPAARLEHI